jgi:hypothetical protein
MNGYDQRRQLLDPGLTALALRGLHHRDGLYPFLERRRPRPRRPAGRTLTLLGAGVAMVAEIVGTIVSGRAA